MQVTVLSNKRQEFNGERFYLCGKYFQRKGRRLHRAVWEYHNGSVPAGYDVHHKDGDRANNQIDNLALLPRKEHHSIHMASEERKAKSREYLDVAREYANKWHGSPDGLAWHSLRGKENWKMRGTQTYVCTWCGQEFQTKHMYGAGQNHFCCPNHKAAYRRKRVRDEGLHG